MVPTWSFVVISGMIADVLSTDEELTYDYKFDREIHSEDRIPCLCGHPECKGFLN